MNGSELQHLGKVDRLAPCGLFDLLATAEPIGNDERFGRGRANGWQQDPLADRL